ncbi:MAG: cytochrome P450 [Kutzneria sp.]|nr:cytochrome P450 [Kutzneria sp.]
MDAWLVTRYDDVRAVLGDPDTFDVDASSVSMIGVMQPEGSAESDSSETPAERAQAEALTHAKIRRLLLPEFTPRRTRQLAFRVAAFVDEHLDKLAHAGHPADLIALFARPIPLLVICELVGVPKEDRTEFQRWNTVRLDTTSDPRTKAEATKRAHAHMSELVARHRKQPGNGVLGRLVAEHGHEFDDATLTGLVDLLLLAGYESTASMIGLGVLLLLQNPEQRALVCDDETADGAIEEILRYLTVGHTTMPRVARKNTVIGTTKIAAGDIVMCSLPGANRDPDFVEDPDRLDLTRGFNTHVSFGYGMHSCFGAPLARMQLRFAYRRLFERFPALRLAIPLADVEFQTESISYGILSLPVSW